MDTQRKVQGQCCCGAVEYTVDNEFSNFYYCHCEQCRKLTGSAFAANLFSKPDAITWLKGEDLLVRYDHPERAFTKVFCSCCGSGLPFVTQSKQYLIVPAGSLVGEPALKPKAQIFCANAAPWHVLDKDLMQYDGFPK